jgi:ribosomal protein L37AE/L43A
MPIRAHRSGDFRVCTPDSEIPLCNSCGAECATHKFRPGIAFRCVECVERFGTEQTVTIRSQVRDIEHLSIRLSAGEGHIGYLFDFPES